MLIKTFVFNVCIFLPETPELKLTLLININKLERAVSPHFVILMTGGVSVYVLSPNIVRLM